MKIDWKKVSKSPGYISIKDKYIYDASKGNTGRSKQELYRHFKWIISRAKHYAYTKNVDIEVILNYWASDSNRDYWWLNAYQDNNLPRLDRTPYIPMGPKGLKKYYSTYSILTRNKIKNNLQKSGKKKRWSMNRKKKAKRSRELTLKYGL